MAATHPSDPSVDKTSAAGVPDPEDPRKPDSPGDLDKSSWKAVLKRTLSEFNDDHCTDWAAALTYYGILSVFPAVIALVSVLGLFGDKQKTYDALIGIVQDIGPSSAVNTFKGPLQEVVGQPGKAGLLLVVGLLGALWSASGYVAAFSRASNAIYEVEEGRPFYKLRPLQVLVTLVCVLLIAFVAIGLVVTGPLAHAVGNAIGLGDAAVTAWSILKWPLMILVVSAIFSLLYYAAPNVQQPKIKWFTLGGLIALLVWIVASIAFGLYVANFGSYDKTYGSLGAVISFLVWVWLSNCALLFGAEFNAELERGRELAAGMAEAEETIQLPPRDTTKIDKKREKDAASASSAE